MKFLNKAKKTTEKIKVQNKSENNKFEYKDA